MTPPSTWPRRARRPLLPFLLLLAGGFATLLVAAGSQASADACPDASLRTGPSANLPDCRAYELVSPAQKNGGGVVADSRRTRAAVDGNAVGWVALGAFADAIGTGIGTDYLSKRTGTPGTSGWSTHAITPLQSGTTYDGIIGGLEPAYMGEFTPDLSGGVFFAESPLTADAATANVAANLYRRMDLLTPGTGSYELLTACPVCAVRGTVLPAPSDPNAAFVMRPWLAWASPNLAHLALESPLALTADTPLAVNRLEVYEWDQGTVQLAGRVPSGGASSCDDVGGPACVASAWSIAGQGATNRYRTPHVISDGSDGHVRVFFTVPTNDGVTITPGGSAGQLYMRVDGRATVQLNAPERSVADNFAPAKFLDASSDGERVFFMTPQALTDDAPADGSWKIYMYDASTPPSAAGHLTFLNADHEPGDGTSSNAQGMVGASDDGHYAYFVSSGQIVSGQPLLGPAPGLFLWHDGSVSYIGVASAHGSDIGELFGTGTNVVLTPRQARVAPDGRRVLYSIGDPAGHRELYLYTVGGGAPACVSCNPSGAPTSTDATTVARANYSATNTGWHENHALSADGSRVFFSTGEALVPEDVNGRYDVYEYDTASGSVHLISSGTSTADSWFLDATPSGNDMFFTTRDRLVRWDTDSAYDLYDARVDGGFPEPPAPPMLCDSNDACLPPVSVPPIVPAAVSPTFLGPSNASGKLKARPRPCKRGYVRIRVKGTTKCVKRPRPAKRRAKRARTKAARA